VKTIRRNPEPPATPNPKWHHCLVLKEVGSFHRLVEHKVQEPWRIYSPGSRSALRAITAALAMDPECAVPMTSPAPGGSRTVRARDEPVLRCPVGICPDRHAAACIELVDVLDHSPDGCADISERGEHCFGISIGI